MGRVLSVRFPVAALQIILLMSSLLTLAKAQRSVTTWHNDNLRTGQNTNETTLTALAHDRQKPELLTQLCASRKSLTRE